jgi:hypothetical protein
VFGNNLGNYGKSFKVNHQLDPFNQFSSGLGEDIQAGFWERFED